MSSAAKDLDPTARRPDLAAIVTLPHEYQFDLTDGERVWFDAEAAAQSST